MGTVTVQLADITKLQIADAIVSAANGIGIAGRGVAGAITRAAGETLCSDGLVYRDHIRKIAKAHNWYEPGEVYLTDSGGLRSTGIKVIMHAVTMKYPGGPTSYSIVDKCLHNICATAIEQGFHTIAIPGLGTGIGNLDPKLVAKSTVQTSRKFAQSLDIIVIDLDPVFVEAARTANSL